MSFPSLRPSTRQFDPGNWPIQTFKAQDGAEVRLLYGNRRTGMTMALDYSNLSDAKAEEFLSHYVSTRGTFDTFTLPEATLAGWAGSAGALTAVESGNRWRYAEPPSIQAVRPGISSVRVSLVGVF